MTTLGIQLIALILLFSASVATSAPKTIGVFVALADNAHQGIVPVPAAIGNGDDPDKNLYWGTAEGLRGVFDKSSKWDLLKADDDPDGSDVIRVRTYTHASTGAVLTAKAYRGAAIRTCITDFEAAIRSKSFDLVVFIGHNGLMDFDLPVPDKPERLQPVPDCIVLCCKSEVYFKTRIEQLGGRPVLLTTQLMYPGAFILHDAAEAWMDGQSLVSIRERAGAAYSTNQKLSKKAGLGVFSQLGP